MWQRLRDVVRVILYGKSVYRHLKRAKGYHMVDIMNELDVDCAVYGNHEFDFGIGPLQAGFAGRHHADIRLNQSAEPLLRMQ